MKRKLHPTTLVALLALAPLSGAFAAESADLAKEAKARMENLRAEAAKIRNQVGLTLEELKRMQKENVDLREQLKKYSAEVKTMEALGLVVRERVNQMEGKGYAFFKVWEDQIRSIQDQDIRNQAQKRYNKRLKSYDKIVKAMGEARDQLVPFMSDLKDFQKLLDSELSRESVKSAKGLIKQTNWHGDDVVESLKDVETELDRVSAELAKYR